MEKAHGPPQLPTIGDWFAKIRAMVSESFDQEPQLWTSSPEFRDMAVQEFFHPPGNGYALLVGINRYIGAPELRGAVNDANDMKDLAIAEGWKSRNIKLLLDEQATRANVLRKLRWLVSRRNPDDSLLFHFSGHGGRTLTREGWQSCFCCADYASNGTTAEGVIANTEFNAEIVNKSEGAKLLVFMDTCSSGGMFPSIRPQKQLSSE